MTGREQRIIHLFTRGHKKPLLSHIEHKALTTDCSSAIHFNIESIFVL